MEEIMNATEPTSAESSQDSQDSQGSEGEILATSSDIINTATNDTAPRFKVKVGGEESEISIEELIRGYQHQSYATKKQQEAAEIRKQMQQFQQSQDQYIKLLQTNPAKALKMVGLNPREVAEKYLIEQLEWESLSEEERETKTRLQRLEEYEKAEREYLKEQQQREMQLQIQRAADSLDEEVATVLQRFGQKPTPLAIKQMAEVMLAALDTRGERISAEEAYRRIQQDYDSLLNNTISSLDLDTLLARLTKDQRRALEARLVKAQAPKIPSGRGQVAPNGTPQDSSTEGKRKPTWSEVFGKKYT